MEPSDPPINVLPAPCVDDTEVHTSPPPTNYAVPPFGHSGQSSYAQQCGSGIATTDLAANQDELDSKKAEIQALKDKIAAAQQKTRLEQQMAGSQSLVPSQCQQSLVAVDDGESISLYIIAVKRHTKHASAPQERRFPFLQLPPELRNRIYEFALVPNSYVHISSLRSVNSTKPRLGVHMLRTCRQINKEGSDVLYSKTNFFFRSFRWRLVVDTLMLGQAFGRLGSNTIRLIRHFTLTVRVHHGNDRLRTPIKPTVDWNGIQHMTNLQVLQIIIGAHPAIMKVWNSRPKSSSILHGIIANTVAATPKSVALDYRNLTRQKSEADEAAYHQSLQTKGKSPDPLLLGLDDKAVWYLHIEVFADGAEQYRPLRGSKWDKPAVTWSRENRRNASQRESSHKNKASTTVTTGFSAY